MIDIHEHQAVEIHQRCLPSTPAAEAATARGKAVAWFSSKVMEAIGSHALSCGAKQVTAVPMSTVIRSGLHVDVILHHRTRRKNVLVHEGRAGVDRYPVPGASRPTHAAKDVGAYAGVASKG